IFMRVTGCLQPNTSVFMVTQKGGDFPLKDISFPNVNDGGFSYLCMYESTNKWKLSRKSINSTSGALANTLKPLLDFYKRKTEGFGYILYNDQPPDLYFASASFGHSKGVVMLYKQTGVWLSHTTPKFPTYCKKDFWAMAACGNLNAQVFMCVTYSCNQFKEIGRLGLRPPKPFTLSCNRPWFRVRKMISMKGRGFYNFAKCGRV
uniref:Deoxyribonuclease-2-alpha n=1 Tax=Mastacembelus armatus TaxID=205130 RepID=A0A3Q3NBP6_9TELE